MKNTSLPADQQFFADLFSGLVLNPQRLGRVWFATQPSRLPEGSLCTALPRLDVVLRGEYGNQLEKTQHRLAEGEMLFIPARAANLPISDKPVMLLSMVFAPGWLGLSFYDNRTASLLRPVRHIELSYLQRGEGEAMLTALTHLSRSAHQQDVIQPLTLSLLHLCRSVVNTRPDAQRPRSEFLFQSMCNWVQDNYAQPLTRDSVACFFNITPNHLSKLFTQHGSMSFVEYVRWVRMAKARMILQKYHLSIAEVAERCGYQDSDYFCRLFRRQFGLTPGEYSARFQRG
ncbi:helix-turn-helix transcriptional regulator [Kluyvera sp. STS39-E]|uniref:helix-turn-helix transcriptional regulator n=1 Tax=Kluyvera sp. STS39-E TaxID=3234748 RepID=UPI0034C65E61